MKGVHCSWVDMLKIRDALSAGERVHGLSGYVSFDRRADLPAASGIYLAFVDAAPLYAGMSGCLRARWAAHNLRPYLSRLESPFVAYTLLPGWCLRAEELSLIKYYRPVWQRGRCFSPAEAPERLTSAILYRNALHTRIAERVARLGDSR